MPGNLGQKRKVESISYFGICGALDLRYSHRSRVDRLGGFWRSLKICFEFKLELAVFLGRFYRALSGLALDSFTKSARRYYVFAKTAGHGRKKTAKRPLFNDFCVPLQAWDSSGTRWDSDTESQRSKPSTWIGSAAAGTFSGSTSKNLALFDRLVAVVKQRFS